MFRVIFRGLLARKFRLFATALAVTLGVAFMAGTLVLTNTISRTFNDLSAGVYKGTDAEVRAAAVFSGPQFTVGSSILIVGAGALLVFFAGHRHRPARHRQHAGAVHLRAHS
jgi:hypothetical protein